MDHGRRRMRSRDLIGPLLFILSAIQDSHLTDAYDLTRRIVDFNASSELDSHHHPCHLNRAEVPKPEDLLGCGNSSLFEIWRPKARLIGSRGWMNDPMGICRSCLFDSKTKARCPNKGIDRAHVKPTKLYRSRMIRS